MFLVPSLALLPILAHVPVQDGDDELPLLGHAALSERLAELAASHPEMATLHPVAVSREGRSVEALRITRAQEPSERPAVLLIGNLEGPRVFESAVVLHHASSILEREEASPSELLESTVLWFVPRANPDAAEARFLAPRRERWASSSGVDNDRDGRRGEDPPADVNGDGFVTWMRVRDPKGSWREDPTDPRVLVPADRTRGERGEFALHVESRDLDGDETPGEDPLGDTRLDRNFPSGWEEHSESGGLFPTDEPEVRGLCEFVMAQRNLVLVVTYDGQSNLASGPKRVADDAKPVKRVPKPGVLESDAVLVAELGERYREAVESHGHAPEGTSDAGTFGRWCYDHRGLFTLETVLWSLPDEPEEAEQVMDPADEGAADASADGAAATTDEEDRSRAKHEPEPSADAKHLAWADSVGESWRVLDWTPFEHPELGPVEIGGFAPFARLEPPARERLSIAESHLEWFLGLGERLPRVSITTCTMERLGESSLWRVEAVLVNDGYLPALSRSMRRTRTTRPLRARIVLPEGAELVAGGVQELVEDLPGSGGRTELTWLVRGPAGMDLRVSLDSDHLGVSLERAEVVR